MIKIQKGGDTHIVSKGAYENYFKPLGYTIVDKPKKIEEKQTTGTFRKIEEAPVENEKKDDRKVKKSE